MSYTVVDQPWVADRGRHIHCVVVARSIQTERLHPPPQPVHRENRDQCGRAVHHPRDDRRHQRRVAAEADRPEEHRRIEHEHVHPRQLLEERDGRHHRQMGPVLSRHQLRPRPAAVIGRRRQAGGGDEVVELVEHVVHAADVAEHGEGAVWVAALD
ncbi:P-loop containing nucleoside triphosphatehydrolases superfamily protein [Striga asiatica]|uniref:P-loop containing nucleoside triphosphatehydrolases superfamily protein n=1 Tax=Striga asiatica TaxID=4170 RepID=A0A5A7Q6I3_STRAF|nr:P-loop containing nucleoside triphosphatehydrolases superfamily protein [Striga asiatica]